MSGPDTPGPPHTRGADYAERLETLETARWKRVLDVQAPYRWNLRRLGLGFTLDIGCGIGRNLPVAAGAVDHGGLAAGAFHQLRQLLRVLPVDVRAATDG